MNRYCRLCEVLGKDTEFHSWWDVYKHIFKHLLYGDRLS